MIKFDDQQVLKSIPWLNRYALSLSLSNQEQNKCRRSRFYNRSQRN